MPQPSTLRRYYYEFMFKGYIFGDAVKEARAVYTKYKNISKHLGALPMLWRPHYKLINNPDDKQPGAYEFVIAEQAKWNWTICLMHWIPRASILPVTILLNCMLSGPSH